MDDCKMDFTSGNNVQGCKKVDRANNRTRGRLMTVFSQHRHDKGMEWKECFVKQYIKMPV